ncbi:MAG: hypothetical protein K6B44_02840 [Lachnospiraceae bacterium]|nr:hypothetical protein [Lachnospiraceae bacterium]
MNKRKQASMTLEAALTLPLYLFFFMSLLSVIQILTDMQKADASLCRSASAISVYAPAGSLASEDPALASTVMADGYALASLKKDVPSLNPSLLRSSVMKNDDTVDLRADYRIEPLINPFKLPGISLSSRAYAHAWTGFDAEGSGSTDSGDERIVYITETGTVYHLSRSCSHLNLTILAIRNGTQDSYRNNSGEKYTVCALCGTAPPSQAKIFITSEGSNYHSSLSCSALKRTIYEIPISEVGSRKACSRCGGK